MRRIIQYATVLMIGATSAASETQEDFEASAMQMALAANCRAAYGEHELFELAFSRFEKVAQQTGQDISEEEIKDTKQRLYEIEAEPEENVFMRGFCQNLKEQLLP